MPAARNTVVLVKLVSASEVPVPAANACVLKAVVEELTTACKVVAVPADILLACTAIGGLAVAFAAIGRPPTEAGPVELPLADKIISRSKCTTLPTLV